MSATAPAVVPPNIMVLVSPVKGQEDRVAELIEQVSQAVKAHEPWIRYYRWYAVREVESDPDEHDRERGHGGVTEFYVVFRYTRRPDQTHQSPRPASPPGNRQGDPRGESAAFAAPVFEARGSWVLDS
ncbi:hypothetical protein HRR83_007016 [Exophiala dermatitidis]|nr:hypothetical protein HRR73_006055 [Exophiala dermatitidis]KAJ4568131.1 hypothetical protein HRR82_008036 [Exophiala dermatitidis]KAJ4579989.1 hypothetical protein HRR81_002152 [Exophiala dermatitidis]KAJ4592458.1 hypothetical protein HRR83_007016 [Exophiala dermatitidis]KAJ4611375.1 hypothetical protein HRR85_005200 [Exophiala dermatitidis]